MNRNRRGLGLVPAAAAIFAALALAPLPALAGPEVDACGAAVASPTSEPDRRDTGIDWWNVNVDEAVQLCEAALAAEPESIEAAAWLARAYNLAGRIDDARPLMKRAAEAGNVLGQSLYGDDLRVQGDLAGAIEQLTAAADAGSYSAMMYLGEFYQYGWDVETDPAKALALYEAAFDDGKGNPEAATYAGYYYYEGAAGPVDYKTAAEWFQRGADAGDPVSAGNLGYAYRVGEGVEVDYAKAKDLLEIAANVDLNFAVNNLAVMYRRGQGVEVDFPKAMELFARASDLGNTDAAYNLAMIYYNSEPGQVEQNFTEAAKYFEIAADRGKVQAYQYIVALYYNGAGVERSIDQAIKYAGLGAEAGDVPSMNQYAILLRERAAGDDYVEALNYAHRAAAEGNAEAMSSLAIHYLHGYGTAADGGEALLWATKSAEQNYFAGQRLLGELFERGFGVPQDLDRARENYQLAANQGDPEAVAALARLDAGETIPPLE